MRTVSRKGFNAQIKIPGVSTSVRTAQAMMAEGVSSKQTAEHAQSSARLLNAQAFSVRMLTYLSFAATLAAGLFTERFPVNWTLGVALLVLFPLLTQLVTAPLRRRYPDLSRSFLALLDALIFGIVIAGLGLNPLLSLLLGILAGSAFVAVGSLSILSTALLTMIAGAGSIVHYFPQWIGHNPSTAMLLTAAGFIGLYVLVSAGYLLRLARRLQQTREALSQQTEAHRTLSQKLSKYIAPQVWQTISSGRKDVQLESTRKRLVIFFSDLQGFTRLTDHLEPDTLTIIINQYFEEMTRIAMHHGGTIDKFIGDSVMVFFGDPESKGSQRDALDCVTMALAMRRKMSELKRRWRKELGIEADLNVRMGINTGFCTVGNFGSQTRMDYTIMGREVNLASRLESSAGANEILISRTTHELVSQVISNRHKGDIRAKGFSDPVPVYEVVGLRRELGEQSLFTDVDLSGFSMQFDMDRLKNYDKDRILTALAKAHRYIKKGLH